MSFIDDTSFLMWSRLLMEYRGSADTSASTTCVKPTSAAIGDVVVVLVASGTPGLTLTTGGGGGAWTRSELTWAAHGYTSILFCRTLNATDVAQSWTFSGASNARAYAWIGNDAGTVTVKDTTINGTGQASLTLTGFATANTHAVIAIVIDRDSGITPVTPADFISRSSAVLNGSWVAAVADNLDAYAGTNVVWTGLDAGADDFAEVGWLLEVSGA